MIRCITPQDPLQDFLDHGNSSFFAHYKLNNLEYYCIGEENVALGKQLSQFFTDRRDVILSSLYNLEGVLTFAKYFYNETDEQAQLDRELELVASIRPLVETDFPDYLMNLLEEDIQSHHARFIGENEYLN